MGFGPSPAIDIVIVVLGRPEVSPNGDGDLRLETDGYETPKKWFNAMDLLALWR